MITSQGVLMFENLTNRLSKTFRSLTTKGNLTEGSIKDALKEVKKSLLEADVALSVIEDFTTSIKKKVLNTKVERKKLTPSQFFIKLVKTELEIIMGGKNEGLNLNVKSPAVILVTGLQGVGKTTSTAKLALFIKNKSKRVAVVSTDIYRPAAITQLEVLANEVGVSFISSNPRKSPVEIASTAFNEAKLTSIEVLIIDTAGRLHIDADMMDEIQNIHNAIVPIETLFVVDALAGQDAANTAKVFNTTLPITGVILTKIDGDSRGGSALSVRAVTGKPIKFIGTGEKNNAFELFHPERIASRILGMGDILSLIEQVEESVKKVEAKKIKNKKSFDFEDLQNQMRQMSNMGGVSSIMDKLPIQGIHGSQVAKIEDNAKKQLRIMESLINSMTPNERHNPDLISGSRRRRIAKGSGRSIQDMGHLIKQHKQMQKMMKKMSSKGGISKVMQRVSSFIPAGRIK